jgi:hypothetical protein
MSHPAIGQGAFDDRDPFSFEQLTQFIVAGSDHGHYLMDGSPKVAQGGNADRNAVRQWVPELAAAKTGPRSRCQQNAGDHDRAGGDTARITGG